MDLIEERLLAEEAAWRRHRHHIKDGNDIDDNDDEKNL